MTLWYALIDLLPFQWAEPGKMYFMKNALLAILVISPLFGLLSTLVVEKRMAFFSDALGHSAFTGVAIGTLCGLVDATWCAVALAVVFALLFTWVQSRTRMAVALGIFISTLDGHSFTKFNSLLIGDILSVSPAKIAILALILLLVMVFWVLRINRLTLTATYPVLAVSRGVQVNLLDALFNCAIADLGGAAGHQFPAGAARCGRSERGQEYAPVHLAGSAGRGGVRHRRTDALFLCGVIHRCLHYPLSRRVLRRDLLLPASEMTKTGMTKIMPVFCCLFLLRFFFGIVF